MIVHRSLALGLAFGVLAISSSAHAGLYWFNGTRSKTITVCFVGDAVTARPPRVNEVLADIRRFEHIANIKFDYLGQCPAKTVLVNGNDFYNGDIRIVLRFTTGTKVSTWKGEEGTGPVPGKGCRMFTKADGTYCDAKCNPNGNNDGWGSWSNAPDEQVKNRACLYNLKLGDDPWAPADAYLNHTLHEFGHALGLRHEHERNDVDKSLGCTEAWYGGGATTGHMTPYDKHSVMHYEVPSCKINGNYDHTGLSDYDRLALQILYPEDNKLAEYIGSTVRRAGQAVLLQSAWKARGANLGFVAKNFNWSVDNSQRSRGPDLSVTLPPGRHSFVYSYEDFLGRRYTATGAITVLAPAAYDRVMGASQAAQLPLF